MREKALLIEKIRKLQAETFETGAELDHQSRGEPFTYEYARQIIDFACWLMWLADELEGKTYPQPEIGE